jgi:hypothetical protein
MRSATPFANDFDLPELHALETTERCRADTRELTDAIWRHQRARPAIRQERLRAGRHAQGCHPRHFGYRAGRYARLSTWRRRNDREGVQSAQPQSDSIKSDQCGRLMLALGDEQLSKKVDVRMASFRAEGDASRLRSASVENASIALQKNASPDEIHRLRLADIPWSLAAPGPHGKHLASNRLRDICVPRLLELFCENRRALPI